MRDKVIHIIDLKNMMINTNEKTMKFYTLQLTT